MSARLTRLLIALASFMMTLSSRKAWERKVMGEKIVWGARVRSVFTEDLPTECEIWEVGSTINRRLVLV